MLRSREEAEVSSTVTTLEEEEVKRLHNKVAETVMMTMNQYWPGASGEVRRSGLRRITPGWPNNSVVISGRK